MTNEANRGEKPVFNITVECGVDRLALQGTSLDALLVALDGWASALGYIGDSEEEPAAAGGGGSGGGGNDAIRTSPEDRRNPDDDDGENGQGDEEDALPSSPSFPPGRLRAFKAHVTMNEDKAESARTPKDRQFFEGKADEMRKQIEAIAPAQVPPKRQYSPLPEPKKPGNGGGGKKPTASAQQPQPQQVKPQPQPQVKPQPQLPARATPTAPVAAQAVQSRPAARRGRPTTRR